MDSPRQRAARSPREAAHLGWLYLRKLKFHRSRTYLAEKQHTAHTMVARLTPRRWRRCPVELPVRVVFRDGAEKVVVPGRGTELSQGGMALYAGLPLKPGDLIEIEFQIPSRLQVSGIIRDRNGYCFGLEFLIPLP